MIRSVCHLLVACILAGAPGSAYAEQTQVVHIRAHMFAYSPDEIVVKMGVPVTLELMSVDRVHGFNLPDFHVRTTHRAVGEYDHHVHA